MFGMGNEVVLVGRSCGGYRHDGVNGQNPVLSTDVFSFLDPKFYWMKPKVTTRGKGCWEYERK